MNSSHAIQETFAELVGLPVWGLRRSHGSMFLFDVGHPMPNIGRRLRGEYGFLVESSHWTFSLNSGKQLVSSYEEPREIDVIFDSLHLGNLRSSELSPSDGSLEIVFESGLQFITTLHRDDVDDEVQWMLFMPDGYVWTKTTHTLSHGWAGTPEMTPPISFNGMPPRNVIC